MKAIEIIEKKQKNEKLEYKEIEYMVNSYIKNKINDDTMSQFVWAIYNNGLSIEETYFLTDVMIKPSKGTVKYRVHISGGKWLPYVTGYNANDNDNGYAGDLKPIDAIEVYYYTPSDVVKSTGYLRAKYRVSPSYSTNYFDWQYDNETSNGQDGYAGSYGINLDKLQITLSQ